MLLAFVAASIVFPASSVQAGVTRSPDVAHTDAFGRMIDHQLRWIQSEDVLVASVTFSNVDFVSRTEARQDERFDFYLPEIRLDAKTAIFYDTSGVPVASLRREIIGSEIHLLPGAKISITNRSGTVHLTLTATDAPRGGLRWVQRDQEGILPNWFG